MKIISSIHDKYYNSVRIANSTFSPPKYHSNEISARFSRPKAPPPLRKLHLVNYKESSPSTSFKSNWNRILSGDVPKDKRILLIGRLNSYLSLPDDWDGYDGVAPNKQTVDDAIRLLHLLPNRVSTPKPMLGSSGTVGLYWEKEDLYIEICFDGDETFWYYARNDNTELSEDDVSLNTNTLSAELLSFLEQF